MKKLTSLTSKLLLLGTITALSLTSAHAANAVWKGSSGSLDTGTNWTGGTGGGNVPATTQVAQFSTDTTPITPTFVDNTTTTWAGISVSQTGNLTLKSSTATTATLDLGTTSTSETLITVASGSGAVTIGDATDDVNIVAAAANAANITDTISNSSSNNLTIQNKITTSGNDTTTLVVAGTGTTVFNGVLANSSSETRMALTVNADATATLNANNNYTGTTLVNGTLNATAAGAIAGNVTVNGTLNATAAGAVGGTATVNTGGTLVFGTAGNDDTAGNVTLNGGAIVMNGGNETIGTLTLAANSVDIINMTAGGTLTLTNISWGSGAKLEIEGWTGTTTGSKTTQIVVSYFGGSYTAWNTNKADVTWSSTSFNGNYGDYSSSAIYEYADIIPAGNYTPVTPAPEPSTVFFGFGLLALLAWGGRQQILSVGRNLIPVRA